MGKKTTHCPQGHEYTDENTAYSVHHKTYADGTPYDQYVKYCKTCKREKAQRYRNENLEEVREYQRIKQKEYGDSLRQQALEAYGGRCVCCGESTPEFLHFDHVNNDGAEHRRELAKNRKSK